jgi:hypothetical protein
LFDLDYDPFTRKKKKNDAQKIRAALTPAMKENIKRVVGYKCEKCGRKGKLQIDHIKEVSKGGTNVGSNLIVLCPSCHAEKLTQAEMKRILAKRSKKVKQDITNILRNRNKVGTEKSTSSKPRSPFDIPSFDPSFSIAPKKKGRKKKKDDNPWRL